MGKLRASCFTYSGPVRVGAATYSLFQELLKQDANSVVRVRVGDK